MVLYNIADCCIEFQPMPTEDCCRNTWWILDPIENYVMKSEVVIRCTGTNHYDTYWNILTDIYKTFIINGPISSNQNLFLKPCRKRNYHTKG